MINRVKYLYSRFGYSGVISAIKLKLGSSSNLLKVHRKDIRAPFNLRLRTSDIATFDQIFIEQEYDFATTRNPRVIVDAGANIGLGSIYFANKYPDSKIIAIEPEHSNFEMLKENVSPYPNIIPVQAALWHKNEQIDVVDPGLGKWGFMTETKNSSESPPGDSRHAVEAMTVVKIMQDFNLERIDILNRYRRSRERGVW